MPMLGIMASGMSGNLWAPSGAYDSISSITLSAAAPSITFTGIPSTYTHLQIRMFYQSVTNPDNLGLTLNGSINSTYWHYLKGNGASATAGAVAGSSANYFSNQDGVSTTSYYVGILDVLDYANTNKNKTMRFLAGSDYNGSGGVTLSSNLYATTNAISSMTIYYVGSNNLAANSSFALYGVK